MKKLFAILFCFVILSIQIFAVEVSSIKSTAKKFFSDKNASYAEISIPYRGLSRTYFVRAEEIQGIFINEISAQILFSSMADPALKGCSTLPLTSITTFSYSGGVLTITVSY